MTAPMLPFAQLQREFVRHLRDPERVPSPPGLEARRLEIYRYAIFASVEQSLRDNFPRVQAVLNVTEWQLLARTYLIQHRASATAFVDVPREFLDYLEHQAPPDPARPFLYELAHFDWLETVIGADPRCIDLSGVQRDGDLMTGVPLANPILSLAHYDYPVHVITAAYQPTAAPSAVTHIAAFRDLDDDYGFLDLSAPAARLLDLICAGTALCGNELVAQVAAELGQEDVAALRAAAAPILARMHARHVILGSARA